MKLYRIASVIIIIHGIIELISSFQLFFRWCGVETAELPYGLPFPEIAIKESFWGVIRIIAGIGLSKKLMWGFILSIIACVIAITMQGHISGLLAGAALILLLIQYFDKKKFIE